MHVQRNVTLGKRLAAFAVNGWAPNDLSVRGSQGLLP